MKAVKEFSLKEKVIIVTGGTGILGEAFINGISEAGGIVGVLGRNQIVADERVASIIGNGGQAIALIADVTKKQQLIDAKEKVMVAYGKVDGLVNAAGGNISGALVQPDEDVFDLNFEALKEVMDLNLFGTVLPTQIFGEAIKQSGSGSIVNISSMA
ncbi:MAG: SDR family NAD(P)-dependent oxidoreductase, partial [Ginsengibacter sp.]